jgi:hypothetical protein
LIDVALSSVRGRPVTPEARAAAAGLTPTEAFVQRLRTETPEQAAAREAAEYAYRNRSFRRKYGIPATDLPDDATLGTLNRALRSLGRPTVGFQAYE